tara:strand:+ start:1185 stop:1517 length:333 start_codon:yes stop_codon:yes gene_type:complete
MRELFTIQAAARKIGINPHRLFQLLREYDFLNKANLPRDRYIMKDLFHIRHRTFEHPVLGPQVSSRAMITHKGIKHVHELIQHKAPEALCARNSSAANESGTENSTRKSA